MISRPMIAGDYFPSNRQAFSALCAPPLQYIAAGLGRHSLKETVSAFSFHVARLKSSLGH